MGKLWYLSPSLQEDNVGLGNYGTEASQMYRLADEITPYLDQYGVDFHVAELGKTLSQRSREAAAMGAGWYLALHSNAGGNGTAYGPIAFYDSAGRALAEKLVSCLLETGQKNNRSANVQQSSALYELKTPAMPACLLEVDFHDSETGVQFLTQRRNDAAKAIAKAIVELDGKTWSDAAPPKPAGTGDHPSAWAKEYTEQAKALGLFQGDGDNNYNWQGYITREQAAASLIRLKNILEGKK